MSDAIDLRAIMERFMNHVAETVGFEKAEQLVRSGEEMIVDAGALGIEREANLAVLGMQEFREGCIREVELMCVCSRLNLTGTGFVYIRDDRTTRVDPELRIEKD
jgi:hypothetical protein